VGHQKNGRACSLKKFWLLGDKPLIVSRVAKGGLFIILRGEEGGQEKRRGLWNCTKGRKRKNRKKGKGGQAVLTAKSPVKGTDRAKRGKQVKMRIVLALC